MFLLGNLFWRTGNGTGGPAPAPPAAPPITPAGGIGLGNTGYRSRPTRKQISRARKILGIEDGTAQVIADVAARQAKIIEKDAQKRFEELFREITLRGIEWEGRYLEALNKERERLIDAEIGLLLRRKLKEDEDFMVMMLLIGASL